MESLLVPLVTFAVFGFFSAWIWVKGYTRKAAMVAAIGTVFAVYAFRVDYLMRVSTIVETFLEGSIEARPGDPAPLRQLRFTVDHPGAAHEVFISPHAPRGTSASFPATVRFVLASPGGGLIEDREHTFYARGGRGRSNWSSTVVDFDPAESGTYTLDVFPITVGIPSVHVKISDAAKRDGRRAPGY